MRIYKNEFLSLRLTLDDPVYESHEISAWRDADHGHRIMVKIACQTHPIEEWRQNGLRLVFQHGSGSDVLADFSSYISKKLYSLDLIERLATNPEKVLDSSVPKNLISDLVTQFGSELDEAKQQYQALMLCLDFIETFINTFDPVQSKSKTKTKKAKTARRR